MPLGEYGYRPLSSQHHFAEVCPRILERSKFLHSYATLTHSQHPVVSGDTYPPQKEDNSATTLWLLFQVFSGKNERKGQSLDFFLLRNLEWFIAVVVPAVTGMQYFPLSQHLVKSCLITTHASYLGSWVLSLNSLNVWQCLTSITFHS